MYSGFFLVIFEVILIFIPNFRTEDVENVKQLYKRFSKDDILNNKVTAKLKCDENRSFIIISEKCTCLRSSNKHERG